MCSGQHFIAAATLQVADSVLCITHICSLFYYDSYCKIPSYVPQATGCREGIPPLMGFLTAGREAEAVKMP